jgi:RNA polymerase sigma-70 factor (ECF subfamily)
VTTCGRNSRSLLDDRAGERGERLKPTAASPHQSPLQELNRLLGASGELDPVTWLCGAKSGRYRPAPVTLLAAVARRDMDDPRSDEELAAAALREPDAFGVLYRRHVADLTSFALSRTGQAEVAADLVAETFAAALEGLHRFDPRRGEVGAWLHGIARHRLARWARRGAVETRARRRLGIPLRPPDDEVLAEVERLADAESVRVWIHDGLSVLPADERAAVEARVVLDRSYREIAAEASVSEVVVRKRVSRGLARLRARLEQEDVA